MVKKNEEKLASMLSKNPRFMYIVPSSTLILQTSFCRLGESGLRSLVGCKADFQRSSEITTSEMRSSAWTLERTWFELERTNERDRTKYVFRERSNCMTSLPTSKSSGEGYRTAEMQVLEHRTSPTHTVKQEANVQCFLVNHVQLYHSCSYILISSVH